MKQTLTLIFILAALIGTAQTRWSRVDGLKATIIELDSTRAITGNELKGQTFWDETNLTLSTVYKHGVVYQHGAEFFMLVKNQSGATIEDGVPVCYDGAIGASGNIRVVPAWDAAPFHPVFFRGWTTHPIENGEDGLITISGKVRGIQTNGVNYGEVWNNGNAIYINCTTGYPTKTIPSAPNEYILAGVVLASHATVGTIEVKEQMSRKLTELSDVNGTSMTEDGQFIVWDAINEYFDGTANINNYLRNDTVVINIDFKDLSVFYYTVPFDMTLSTQESQNTDAVISPILGTALTKFQVITVTPDTTGLIILSGSR